jgi:lysophospholipase L1-like esterase
MRFTVLLLAAPAMLLLCACGSTSSPSAGAGPDASGAGGGSHASGGSSANAGASGAGSAGMIGVGGSSAGGAGSGGMSGGGGSSAGAGGGSGGTPGAGGGSGSGSGGLSGASGSGTGGTAGAGMSGAAGSSGHSGASGYDPCPTDGSPCKILPLGDSITYGVNDTGNGGYRGPLFASAVAAGKKITFAGSLKNGPTTVSGMTFPQNNEGHSGWGISQVNPNSGGNTGIATLIPNPAFSSSSGGLPNIILLHIGTNDQGTYSATQVTSDLSGLLDKLISNAPNAYIVVAQIIPLGYGNNSVIKTYNQSIPGLVQQRANAGKHITTVDMFTGFVPSTMLGSDSVHPNSAGYQFMASHWYGLIGPMLR